LKLSEEKEDEFFNALGKLCDQIGIHALFQQYNSFNEAAYAKAESLNEEEKTKIGWFQYYCDEFFKEE